VLEKLAAEHLLDGGLDGLAHRPADDVIHGVGDRLVESFCEPD
jgi:hypothetical protein